MGIHFRRTFVLILFCLITLAGVSCSSHDDDPGHHRRDRWDDRRTDNNGDPDNYRPGPRGNRTED